MNGILIIAHTPLASALRQGALHVFPEAAQAVLALDVLPHLPAEETLAQAQAMLAQLALPSTLILTDLFGATPCNVATKLAAGRDTRLLTGVNLPMLVRAVAYRHESLESQLGRAMIGGTQGIFTVAATAPQNQSRRTTNDQDHHDHQQ